MRKRYKVVVNIEVDDPELPFPAGGDYTHRNRIEGLVSLILRDVNWPGLKASITVDKVIDKGEIKKKMRKMTIDLDRQEIRVFYKAFDAYIYATKWNMDDADTIERIKKASDATGQATVGLQFGEILMLQKALDAYQNDVKFNADDIPVIERIKKKLGPDYKTRGTSIDDDLYLWWMAKSYYCWE